MQKMDPLVSRRITWIRSIFCILVVYVHCRNTRWFDVNTAPGIAALENRLCDIFAIIAVPAPSAEAPRTIALAISLLSIIIPP